jgi:uncharacterized LabA/DUF88 family protein
MNVGILWDIENVTPPVGANCVQAVIDAVSEDGRVSYAMAFGDWNEENITKIAYELSENNFELIHTPHKNRKNSADMSLIANGVELIFKYPHIDKFVLVSGDGDFRPLLLSFKKYGKETLLICDISKTTSEELIKMADKTMDYRDIIKRTSDFEEIADENIEQKENNLTKEKAFELFKETVGILIQEKKKTLSTSVKMRMKLLNERFNENDLGYSTWREFVEDAKMTTKIIFNDGCFVLTNTDDNTMPDIYEQLLDNLPQNNDWILFQTIAQKIEFKGSGYNKFKELALDAEKRNYIEIKNDNLDWSMRKK